MKNLRFLPLFFLLLAPSSIFASDDKKDMPEIIEYDLKTKNLHDKGESQFVLEEMKKFKEGQSPITISYKDGTTIKINQPMATKNPMVKGDTATIIELPKPILLKIFNLVDIKSCLNFSFTNTKNQRVVDKIFL